MKRIFIWLFCWLAFASPIGFAEPCRCSDMTNFQLDANEFNKNSIISFTIAGQNAYAVSPISQIIWAADIAQWISPSVSIIKQIIHIKTPEGMLHNALVAYDTTVLLNHEQVIKFNQIIGEYREARKYLRLIKRPDEAIEMQFKVEGFK